MRRSAPASMGYRLVFPFRIESEYAAGAAVTDAGDLRLDGDRAAQHLRAGSDAKRVQAQDECPVLGCEADHIENAGDGIDDRRAGDAVFGNDVVANDEAGDGGGSGRGTMGGAEETCLPQGARITAAVGVRVEGIDAVVLGRDEDYIVSAAIYLQTRHI